MSPTASGMQSRSRGSRPGSLGVTLVEAVLSLAILGIIMASIGAASSVLIRLMPRSDDPRTVAITIGSAQDLLDADIHAAVAVHSATPTHLRLTVNGIGDAGAPASVVYTYDSDKRAILRSVDGQTPRPIATGITDATFDYTPVQRVQGVAVEPVTAASAFGTGAIACNDFTLTMDSGGAIRQRIAPVLEDDAMLWRIESVSMRLKQHVLFSTGSCRISFYYMNDDGTMSATPFAMRSIDISSLTISSLPAAWRTVDFDDMPWLEHTESVAVLLSAHGGSIRTHLASMPGHPSLEVYNRSDGTAVTFSGHLLCFRLSGTSMVPGQEPPAVDLIRDIRLELHHPTLAQPVLHNATPPVPLAVQP